jgi:uncharacterized protein YneF (UPF0154 family)
MKKSQKIILIITSVLAVAGVGYYIYSKQREKRLAKIYEESINQMVEEYGANQIFN